MNIIKYPKKSESEELSRRLVELAQLEAHLAEREVFLERLKSGLAEFENAYYKHILDRFVKLDRIKEEIFLKLKNNNQGLSDFDSIKHESFQDILEQEESLLDNENECNVDSIGLKFPPKKLKEIYRELAKLVHPDLALDEEERKYRQNIMVRANQAYANNDETNLIAILEILEQQLQYKPIESTYNSSELSLADCKISQVKLQIYDIENQIKELYQTEVYQLKLEIEAGRDKNQNMFANMIAQLDREIELASKELESLKKNKK
jgi:hypothetical protein